MDPPAPNGTFPAGDPPLPRQHLFAALTFLVYITAFLLPVLRHFTDQFVMGMDTNLWFPYKWYWMESIKRGDPAFWNPYWVLGGPFLAHPSVGAFSPFNILHLLLPPVAAFNTRFCFFYLWAAFGMYLFLRRLGAGWAGGVLSGFTFAFCAYFTTRNAGYAGHPYVWWAFSWTPWVLYCMDRAVVEKRWAWVALASLGTAFSFFESHLQSAYLVALTAGFYLAGAAFTGRSGAGDTLKIGAGYLLMLSLLVACQVLPSLEFMGLSNRSSLGYGDALRDTLTPVNLRHFVQPDFMGNNFEAWKGRWGYHEIVGYVGLVPLALFLAGMPFLFRSGPYALFFAFVFVFLALSMGDNLPVTKWIHQFFYYVVPGYSMHRSQGRLLAPASFSMACGAGLVLDILIRRFSPGRTPLWAKLLIVLAVVDLWAFGIRFVNPEDARYYDTVRHPGGSIPAVLNDPALIERIQKDPEYPRVRAADNGHYPLLLGVASVTSSDYIWLNVQAVFWGSHYPFSTDPNSPVNDLAVVKYAYFPPDVQLQPGRWKPIATNIYENTRVLPRVLLVGGYQTMPGIEQVQEALLRSKLDPRREIALEENIPGGLPREPGPAGSGRIVKYANNRVEMECQADRACFLSIADNYYPGWKAFVDGKETAIYKANGAFRAVLLPGPGRHEVLMEYRPVRAYAGLLISLSALLGMGLLIWKGRGLTVS